jgi:predicted metal-dependent phosphoesterase TrpH
MNELIVNLHMHTRYSDGHGTHADIARAALQAGLDVVIVTDHNVWVNGPEDYYHEGKQRLLLMVGEEIHDTTRDPQKNHLLVIGAGRELAPFAQDPQRLLDAVKQAGGVSFLAHPVELSAPAIHEPDISWVDWQVQGYTGIELWNEMSEFKSYLKTKLHAIYYAFNPKRAARGPVAGMLDQWDDLLAEGKRVVAIGGTDAHAFPVRLGPWHRVLYPYEFHFQTINTHLLVPQPLTGDVSEDRRMILDAFRQGHAFIGYDLPAPTRGFSFTAHGMDTIANMGDEVSAEKGITFQIRLPQPPRARPFECCLLRDGKVEKTWRNKILITHITTEPGVYRVEAAIYYLGRRRAWIFSNPIYVRAGNSASRKEHIPALER